MGTALSSHDNLIYFRAWTATQVNEVQNTLRRKQPTMCINKDEFARFFGGRNRESISIFNDLDTDFDGKVDVFEVLIALTLWSVTPWEEKLNLLFKIFDFNGKGMVRPDELLFLASTMVRTLAKFVRLDPQYEDFQALKTATAAAFTEGKGTEMSPELFKLWCSTAPQLEELRHFLDDHSEKSAPEAVESPMRKTMRMLEYKCQELTQQIEQLQEKLRTIEGEETDRDANQQKRYDFMLQNLERLIVKLQRAAETQRHELAELTTSLNEDVLNGGLISLIEPRKRFRHEQMLMEIELIQTQCAADFREASDILNKLVELTYGLELEIQRPASVDGPLSAMGAGLRIRDPQETSGSAGIRSRGGPGGLGVVEEDKEDKEAQARRERLLNRDFKKKTMKQKVPGADGALVPVGEAGEDLGEPGGDAPLAPPGDVPVVIAFADFDPPESHESQMLSLRAGDEIYATGQDGQGWWYGRKRDGQEGWFPPSYVQLREEQPPPNPTAVAGA